MAEVRGGDGSFCCAADRRWGWCWLCPAYTPRLSREWIARAR